MKIIDLSVCIEDQLPVDPPQSRPAINYTDHTNTADMLAFFPGATEDDLPDRAGWAVETLTLGSHAGTHMDAPWHYHPTMNGGEPSWTIDEIPLEWCMGDGVMLDFSDKEDGYLCTSEDFRKKLHEIGYRLKPGDIVLIHTSAPRNWGKAEYLGTGCGVGREGTLWLAKQGIHVVGTDAWSWDVPLSYEAKRFEETGDASVIWEGHKAGKDIIYCQMEKLANLDQLPPYGFRVYAFPVKIKGGSAGWVRCVATVDESV